MGQAETCPSHTTSEWKRQDSHPGLLSTNRELFSQNPAARKVWVAFWRGLWLTPSREVDFSTLLEEACVSLARARVVGKQKGVRGEMRLLQKAL